jgi:hypothetical protein
MTTTAHRVIAYAEEAATLLSEVAGLVGGARATGAQHALEAIAAALRRYEGSVFSGPPITAAARDKAIEDLDESIAHNNADADASLASKFDTGGEG